MKKEQKKINKKFKNKRSTYETSYIAFDFMNNAIRYGLETAKKMRASEEEKMLVGFSDISKAKTIYE